MVSGGYADRDWHPTRGIVQGRSFATAFVKLYYIGSVPISPCSFANCIDDNALSVASPTDLVVEVLMRTSKEFLEE